jgi:hypothetical protein
MANESTISKLKWCGISAIMSFITTFILTVFIDYFSNKMRFDNSTIFLYTIPIILGIGGAVLLVSSYILSRRNRNRKDKWRYFPANIS